MSNIINVCKFIFAVASIFTSFVLNGENSHTAFNLTEIEKPSLLKGSNGRSHENVSQGVFIEDGMEYERRDGKLILIKGDYSKKNIVIRPDTTHIGDSAFDGRDGEVDIALESVVIPEGVVEIGMRAFQSCHNLKSVVLPKTLKSVGVMGFRGCVNLVSLTVLSPKINFGVGALLWCKKLKEIKVSSACRDCFFEIYDNDLGLNNNIRVTFLDDYTKSVKNISDENNVDMDILKVLESSIKDAIQCSSNNVKRMATSYASFPSWRMSGVSKAYLVKGYVCIWRKEPFIGINADRRNWEYVLGKEKYRARVEELKKTKFKYLHSFAIYRPSSVPVMPWESPTPEPIIVLTVEVSGESRVPYICAFMANGHKNFGKSNKLSSDNGFEAHMLRALEATFGEKPVVVGDGEKGLSLLKM